MDACSACRTFRQGFNNEHVFGLNNCTDEVVNTVSRSLCVCVCVCVCVCGVKTISHIALVDNKGDSYIKHYSFYLCVCVCVCVCV